MAFCFCFLFVSNCNDTKPIPFESNHWKESRFTEKSINPRPGMATDIMNRKLLEGKNSQEVEEILGEPESKEQNKYSYQTEETYTFFNRLDPVSAEFLYVFFDKENKVEKVEIKTIKFNR